MPQHGRVASGDPSSRETDDYRRLHPLSESERVISLPWRRPAATPCDAHPDRRLQPPQPNTSRPPTAPRGASRYGRRPPARATPPGTRLRIGPIPSRCWRSRPRSECPSSCRSATDGWLLRRLPSIGVRRMSWPRTWPVRRRPACGFSFAAMRIWPTSAPSPRRSASCSSTSTTSTRPFPARGNGT